MQLLKAKRMTALGVGAMFSVLAFASISAEAQVSTYNRRPEPAPAVLPGHQTVNNGNNYVPPPPQTGQSMQTSHPVASHQPGTGPQPTPIHQNQPLPNRTGAASQLPPSVVAHQPGMGPSTQPAPIRPNQPVAVAQNPLPPHQTTVVPPAPHKRSWYDWGTSWFR